MKTSDRKHRIHAICKVKKVGMKIYGVVYAHIEKIRSQEIIPYSMRLYV